jgi:hypothetical protein
MISVRVARLGAEFWERACLPSGFPRDIAAGIELALPLRVCSISSLSIRELHVWLQQRGVSADAGPQRRLHACLVASRGAGFVLINGSDPVPEQRFSLAHEAGHFLLDYEQPRLRRERTLGPMFEAVLDGIRPPTYVERTLAAIADAPLGPSIHLMERGPAGLICGAVAGAECAADELACELLAPEAAVLSLLPEVAASRPYAERERAAAELLREGFGLPDPIASRYARRLLRQQTGGPSTREWLGVAGSG